jgi:hypothetical protein
MAHAHRGAVVKAWRILLATAGILLGLFGIYRLFTQIPLPSLAALGVWLLAALLIHDGLLSPLVVGVGSLLRRFVPDRGRRYLQAALLVGALVTVVALPMIYLRGSQPPVKALLLQNYGLNLTLILGLIAAITLSLYAIQVARDNSPPEPDNQSDEHPPS